MPINTGDKDLDVKANKLLDELSDQTAKQVSLNSDTRISESVAHDFATYKFVLPPKRLRFPASLTTPTVDGSEVDPDIWLEFEHFARSFKVDISDAVVRWWTEEETFESGVTIEYIGYEQDEFESPDYETLKIRSYDRKCRLDSYNHSLLYT